MEGLDIEDIGFYTLFSFRSPFSPSGPPLSNISPLLFLSTPSPHFSCPLLFLAARLLSRSGPPVLPSSRLLFPVPFSSCSPPPSLKMTRFSCPCQVRSQCDQSTQSRKVKKIVELHTSNFKSINIQNVRTAKDIISTEKNVEIMNFSKC